VLGYDRCGDQLDDRQRTVIDDMFTLAPINLVAPDEAALMVCDEPGDQCCGRSSSAAKKADAVFRIALVI
jgi:hypothetical protein